MGFWDAFEGELIVIIGVSAQDLQWGREIARAWPDQAFSLVDCNSFAVIERLGIRRVFAFDEHFRVFRFGLGRGQGLEIVPH